MAVIHYPSAGTKLVINGIKTGQLVTAALDHTTRRVRGMAIAGDPDSHLQLENLRAGDVVDLEFLTDRGCEAAGKARAVMVRLRARVHHALLLFFVFQYVD